MLYGFPISVGTLLHFLSAEKGTVKKKGIGEYRKELYIQSGFTGEGTR